MAKIRSCVQTEFHLRMTIDHFPSVANLHASHKNSNINLNIQK